MLMSMRGAALRLKAKALIGAAAACCAFALVATVPQPASATTMHYCGGTYAPNQNCYGARHTLRQNAVYGGSFGQGASVAASALDTNLNEYGSWVYGAGYACHSYAASRLLYPWLKNAYWASIEMYGLAQYGTGAVGC
ncbi:hypothetical protein [Patulibacter defluvii]|uniref:hypothetical protein n=1 Tax=Patulibacter defluvii TaxID=3095358 RepID=UPI002A75D5CC|nr:hypothetical protein [Patulibacter sp. DM4]